MTWKNYTWNSGDYQKHSSAQFKWAQELIHKLSLNGTETVLDIGCGDGKITALISSYLNEGNIAGIDSSKDMIMLAEKNFPVVKYPNLNFFLMNASNLNFTDQFDIAFSNAALHWIKEQIPVLKGVRKALKKSGRILFQMGGKGNAKDILNAVEESMRAKKWQKYFNDFSFPYCFCSPDEYEKFLDEAGLVPKRLELIPKDMNQKGRNGLAGWIRTTWLPYTDRIPMESRADFIDEIIDLYSKSFPADNAGFFHVKMIRLEVEAINA
ncbi:MAG: methyltransferase domain-containing protein [Spirochaetes bacterium]|nr:methyltransferase domain-containing protein [Spirochaetota bacterium]